MCAVCLQTHPLGERQKGSFYSILVGGVLHRHCHNGNVYLGPPTPTQHVENAVMSTPPWLHCDIQQQSMSKHKKITVKRQAGKPCITLGLRVANLCLPKKGVMQNEDTFGKEAKMWLMTESSFMVFQISHLQSIIRITLVFNFKSCSTSKELRSPHQTLLSYEVGNNKGVTNR